jgi:hypothetical protein
MIGDKHPETAPPAPPEMLNGETNTPLFDTIGHGAEQVDNLADDDEGGQKLVEEIESMCINCEENVRTSA